VFRGELRLEETAGQKPKTRLSLSLYAKALGPQLKALMDDENSLVVTIRGVVVGMEIQAVESRGTLDDLLHLHGPAVVILRNQEVINEPRMRKRVTA
jgi:hypothetical protein